MGGVVPEAVEVEPRYAANAVRTSSTTPALSSDRGADLERIRVGNSRASDQQSRPMTSAGRKAAMADSIGSPSSFTAEMVWSPVEATEEPWLQG